MSHFVLICGGKDMWVRKELKKQAKSDLRKNYWAAIGICFILAFLGIQYADSVGIIHQTSDNDDNYTIIRKAIEEKDEIFLKSIDITDYKESLNDKLSNTQKIAADTLSVYTSHFNWIFKNIFRRILLACCYCNNIIYNIYRITSICWFKEIFYKESEGKS